MARWFPEEEEGTELGFSIILIKVLTYNTNYQPEHHFVFCSKLMKLEED